MKTFVDMDGVLSDFVGGSAKLFGTTEARLTLTWTPGDFEMCHALSLESDDELWRRIDLVPGWWENLDPLPWAKELLDLVRSGPGEVFICSTPSAGRHSPCGKVEWMRRHIDPYFTDYILTSHKYLLAAPDRVLIDDSTANCDRFSRAGGVSVLFSMIGNRNHKHMNYPMGFVREKLAEIWKSWGRHELVQGRRG
jgi:hypothetical protein